MGISRGFTQFVCLVSQSVINYGKGYDSELQVRKMTQEV